MIVIGISSNETWLKAKSVTDLGQSFPHQELLGMDSRSHRKDLEWNILTEILGRGEGMACVAG